MPYSLHQENRPQYYCEAVYTGPLNGHRHLRPSPGPPSLSLPPASSGILIRPVDASPGLYGHPEEEMDMQPLDLSIKSVRGQPPSKQLRLDSDSCKQDDGINRTAGSNRAPRPGPYPRHGPARSPNPQLLTSIPSRSPHGRSESPYYAQRHTPSPAANYSVGGAASGIYSFHPSHPSAALTSTEGSSYRVVSDTYDSSKSHNYFRQYQDSESGSRHDFVSQSGSRHDFAPQSGSRHDFAPQSGSRHDFAPQLVSRQDYDPQSVSRQDYSVRLEGESNLYDEHKPIDMDIYSDHRSVISKNCDAGRTGYPGYSRQLSSKPLAGERVESKETELSRLLASNQIPGRVTSGATPCQGKPFNVSSMSSSDSGDSRQHRHPDAPQKNEPSFKSVSQPDGDSRFPKEVYRPNSAEGNCRISPSFTHTTTLNLIQKPNPAPSGYPSPPASYTSSPALTARQSPTNGSHVAEQGSPSDKENSAARHKSRKSLLLARTAGFFQTPPEVLSVDKLKRCDEKIIHLSSSDDRADDDSTKISLLDFWISKILMERSEETPKKPCGVDYVRRTVDGQRKIRISLVDLIEMQVEQSLKA